MADSGPNGPKIGAALADAGPASAEFDRTCAKFGRDRTRFGRIRASARRIWGKICRWSGQLGPNLITDGPVVVEIGPDLADSQPTLVEVGRHQCKVGERGQHRMRFAILRQTCLREFGRPTLAELGPYMLELGRIRPTSKGVGLVSAIFEPDSAKIGRARSKLVPMRKGAARIARIGVALVPERLLRSVPERDAPGSGGRTPRLRY